MSETSQIYSWEWVPGSARQMRRRDPNKEGNGSMSEKEYKAIRKRVKELEYENTQINEKVKSEWEHLQKLLMI